MYNHSLGPCVLLLLCLEHRSVTSVIAVHARLRATLCLQKSATPPCHLATQIDATPEYRPVFTGADSKSQPRNVFDNHHVWL